jgi:hypothetical protein
VGDDSHFVFHQKILGEDGSVRRGVVMVKKPGFFLARVRDGVFARFYAVAAKRRSRPRNSQFGLLGTGASRYHNCCIDGGTSLQYVGYHLV